MKRRFFFTGMSNARNEFNATVITEDNVRQPLKNHCAYQKFKIHSINDSRSRQHFQGKHVDFEIRKATFYCNDYMKTADGLVEVVGSCTLPPSADLYTRVRPLGAVAAALLLVAGVVTVWREDTRRTAHGRALTCHALCLAAANALQTLWFFTAKHVSDGCEAYSEYWTRWKNWRC